MSVLKVKDPETGEWVQLAVSAPSDDHINALIDAKLAELKSAEGVEF